MLDIVSNHSGLDIGLYDTQTSKAGNILSVQVGSLEYAPLLGIDLAYFLSEDFSFQNSSFQAYLVEVLSNNGINVTQQIALINTLFTNLNIQVGAEENNSQLVAR